MWCKLATWVTNENWEKRRFYCCISLFLLDSRTTVVISIEQLPNWIFSTIKGCVCPALFKPEVLRERHPRPQRGCHARGSCRVTILLYELFLSSFAYKKAVFRRSLNNYDVREQHPGSDTLAFLKAGDTTINTVDWTGFQSWSCVTNLNDSEKRRATAKH